MLQSLFEIIKYSSEVTDDGESLQCIETYDGTSRTITASTFPQDSTPPLWTEGEEYTQLSTTITPNQSDSTFVIELSIQLYEIVGPNGTQAFVFKEIGGDVTSETIGGSANHEGNGNLGVGAATLFCRFSIIPATSSAITFRVRVGADTGTAYLNQNPDYPTNVMGSTLRVTEFANV